MQTTPPSQLNQMLPDFKTSTELTRADLILCRFCHAAITSHRDQLEIGSGHQHRFINPNGLQFLIGCFQLASGCDIAGQPSNEYSWFQGHSWQIARCSDCGEHLGWFYQNGEAHQFFGLIIDKLARYQR